MRASEYDVGWWLGRSQSREYQKAYDLAAGLVSAKKSDLVVEIGCGSGELLRRLRAHRLIGTDITPRMLRLARMNLMAHGKDSEICDGFPDRKRASGMLRRGKALLVRDDYLDSGLPESCADFAIMAFPELEHWSYMDMLSRELEKGAWVGSAENAWLERGELLDEYRDVNKGTGLRRLKGVITSSVVRDLGVHRILRRNGRYMLVDYASVDEPENILGEQEKLTEARGLGGKFEVLDARFIEERRIAEDATVGEEYIDLSFGLHGYSITLFRKR